MLNDEDIEKEIVAKNLNAPRLTPNLVEGAIVSETYTILPGGRTTICELTLQNGFTVRGESSCVSIENFDKDLGEKISRDDAKNKVWLLEAYLLKEKIYRS